MAKKKKLNEVTDTDTNTRFIPEIDPEEIEKINNHMRAVQAEESPAVGSVKIKKAKINKYSTLEIDYSEAKEDGVYDTIHRDCAHLAHEDLINAFRQLVPHLIIMADLREVISDDALLNEYNLEEKFHHIAVTGFSIGGSGDNEGVTISGMKTINGKTLNINTPFTTWMEGYTWASTLSEAIERCKYEVKEYLAGKQAFRQIEIDFEELEETGS